MSKSRFVIAAVVLALLGASCGGTTSSTPGTAPAADGGATTGTSCSDLAAAAYADVVAAVDSNRSCTKTSDCKSIELSASCFDSCSIAISIAGETAFNVAQDKANQKQCKQFTSQGCKVTIPPCEPPSAVTCTNGKCT